MDRIFKVQEETRHIVVKAKSDLPANVDCALCRKQDGIFITGSRRLRVEETN